MWQNSLLFSGITFKIKLVRTWSEASERIKKDNPAGLLKLWEIATESISAENSEVASEQVRGYLYSKPGLWIRAFSSRALQRDLIRRLQVLTEILINEDFLYFTLFAFLIPPIFHPELDKVLP